MRGNFKSSMDEFAYFKVPRQRIPVFNPLFANGKQLHFFQKQLIREYLISGFQTLRYL